MFGHVTLERARSIKKEKSPNSYQSTKKKGHQECPGFLGCSIGFCDLRRQELKSTTEKVADGMNVKGTIRR